jgi:hypothetical protein
MKMDEIHQKNLTHFREVAISSSSSIYLTFFLKSQLHKVHVLPIIIL